MKRFGAIRARLGSRAATAIVAGLAALAGVALLGARPAAQRPPVVAAAANLNAALGEIEEAFRRQTGDRIEIVYGASGTLTRQVEDGAPFELFLAADEDFPQRLAEAGLTQDDGVVYAVGRLALFAPTGSALTVDRELVGLARLIRAGAVTRFAIANPNVAPYGKAAEAVLRKRGLWNALGPHLVYGDSVAQAVQFATSGNAVGGLVALSIIRTPGFIHRGHFAIIPEGDHPPIRQRMVLLKRAGPAVTRFYEFLQGETARALFAKHGYGTPQ